MLGERFVAALEDVIVAPGRPRSDFTAAARCVLLVGTDPDESERRIAISEAKDFLVEILARRAVDWGDRLA